MTCVKCTLAILGNSCFVTLFFIKMRVMVFLFLNLFLLHFEWKKKRKDRNARLAIKKNSFNFRFDWKKIGLEIVTKKISIKG